MENEVKLTKLASCAGCGAKVGAGTLAKMLNGFKTHKDDRLIVGYDKPTIFFISPILHLCCQHQINAYICLKFKLQNLNILVSDLTENFFLQ